MKKTKINWMSGFYEHNNLIVGDWISIKPEYLNHEHISGNKLRKLKYNILEAKKNGSNLMLFNGSLGYCLSVGQGCFRQISGLA